MRYVQGCRDIQKKSAHLLKMGKRDRRIPTLDLFSGIGGFSLGLRSACRTVAYCEKDERCRIVLEARMRDGDLDKAMIHPDIVSLQPSDVDEKPVMVTAGFPCQDIAVTNYLGKGLSGHRSGLVWRAIDLIAGLKSVRHVLFENSPNIVNHGVESLLSKLREIGFTTIRADVFTAKEVGAPHLRKRWFCWASKGDLLTMSRTIPVPNRWADKRTPDQLLGCTDLQWCRDLRYRTAMLGNAVVPQTVLLAFESLSRDIRTLEKTPRRVDLTISDGTMTFHRQSWNTPCGSYRLWFPVRLSERTSRVMIVQLVYDLNNQGLLKRILSKSKGEEVSIVANPEFIEWLCGYPLGWTQNQ